MAAKIKLIAGLANPGKEYEKTRHNAGAWLVERLAEMEGEQLRFESKFQGLHTSMRLYGDKCHLLVPTTFMNLSGQSLHACMNYNKIEPEEVLIVHDEIDLEPGIARLKFDGGNGGHNGLKDIINHLHTKKFYRLRIGVGHPGSSKQVADYVLKQPSKADKQAIDRAIDDAMHVLPMIMRGDTEKAMHALHTN